MTVYIGVSMFSKVFQLTCSIKMFMNSMNVKEWRKQRVKECESIRHVNHLGALFAFRWLISSDFSLLALWIGWTRLFLPMSAVGMSSKSLSYLESIDVSSSSKTEIKRTWWLDMMRFTGMPEVQNKSEVNIAVQYRAIHSGCQWNWFTSYPILYLCCLQHRVDRLECEFYLRFGCDQQRFRLHSGTPNNTVHY
jgi:hypothetical protein